MICKVMLLITEDWVWVNQSKAFNQNKIIAKTDLARQNDILFMIRKFAVGWDLNENLSLATLLDYFGADALFP